MKKRILFFAGPIILVFAAAQPVFAVQTEKDGACGIPPPVFLAGGKGAVAATSRGRGSLATTGDTAPAAGFAVFYKDGKKGNGTDLAAGGRMIVRGASGAAKGAIAVENIFTLPRGTAIHWQAIKKKNRKPPPLTMRKIARLRGRFSVGSCYD